MTQLADEKLTYLSNFSTIEKQIGAGNRMWLNQLRSAAMKRFSEVGFPSTKLEDWRFTNVAPLAKIPFKPAEFVELHGDDIAEHMFGDEAAAEIVFVNGQFASNLSVTRSLPRNARVMSLGEALETDPDLVQIYLGKLAAIDSNPFVALNSSFIQDGAFIYLPRGTVVEKPIHLIFASAPGKQPTVSHPRVVVVAEENSQASIAKSFVATGDGVYFDNSVTEIVVGDNARVDFCKLQEDSPASFHVSSTNVRIGRTGTFVSHSATLGGKLTRNDFSVVLAGAGGDATVNGLVLIGRDQHCDNHTLLDHAAPNCPSHELYKHVLSENASGVFKGKILVRQVAQKTDSKQTSRSLLLSDEATMNSQPALEIYADDVKCTHGSTTGPVDEDMVFYLQSRGVGRDAAKQLLSYAFAADVTRRIKIEPVRRRIENIMAAQHALPQDLRITDLAEHDEAHR